MITTLPKPIDLKTTGIAEKVKSFLEKNPELTKLKYESTQKLSKNTTYKWLCGELATVHFFGWDIDEHLRTTPIGVGDGGSDIVIKGLRFDVKTKTSNKNPRIAPFWAVDVKAKQANLPKKVDGYIFTYYQPAEGKRDERIHPLGYMSKPEYLLKSVYLKKGDVVTNTRTGYKFTCKEDEYWMEISKLHPLEELL